MQEGYEDYYGEEGCCLTCPDEVKEENTIDYNEYDEIECLCFDCKCKQCYWYEDISEFTDGEKEGRCEYVSILKKEREEENNHYIGIVKEIIKETDKAILCIIEKVADGKLYQTWIPLSVTYKGEERTYVEGWWFKQALMKGIEEIKDEDPKKIHNFGLVQTSLTQLNSKGR